MKLFWIFMIGLGVVNGMTATFEELKRDAEKLYAEGSYQQAHELYRKVTPAGLSTNDQRFVAFRLADTLWRSVTATSNPDTTDTEKALAVLRELTREGAPQDRTFAEAAESLGDFFWSVQRRDWGQGWPNYQKALEYWAGSINLELAADRYLRIVWKATRPPHAPEPFYYGYYGNSLPLQVLENAVKIARSEEDQSRAHFLLAMALRSHGGEWEQRRRIPEEFEAAIKLKKDTDWYDDALFNYAQWMEQNGRAVRDDQGDFRFQPDYVKALEMYRRVVAEFEKGESRYFDQAQRQIEEITRVTVQPIVHQVFIPGSEIMFNLNWRNVKRIDLSLFKIDLTEDVQFTDEKDGPHDWIREIDPRSREKIKSWTQETSDTGRHEVGSETVRLEGKLAVGAYLLETSGGGVTGKEVILVSDAALMVKSSGTQSLIYFCDAATGAPITEAEITVWIKSYDGTRWTWRKEEKTTNNEGIALFDIEGGRSSTQLFVSGKKGNRQAFSLGNSNHWSHQQRHWKIYAFTDRPAYRPGEVVKWKATAREFDGGNYTTPGGKKISMKVLDPRGAEIKVEPLELNSFGSAWGEIEVTAEMPLGEYLATFFDSSNHHIGEAVLFRLEEYKLPEFKVTIQTPEKDGKKATFLLGEKVEVEIQADYYFGGPVANATVEVVVNQSPFYHYWTHPREFDWFYDDSNHRTSRRYRHPGQEVQRETLKTDPEGKAKLVIQTNGSEGNDLEYRIEARVTDSSRREITGTDSIRVTRQRYYVYPRPIHKIFKPQDKVEVEFTAIDANNNPVVAEGTVSVTRERWIEIWVNPEGNEVRGPELARLKARGIFPPPSSDPDLPGWRLKFRGYEQDPILTRTLKTGTNGVATMSFTAEREGYYKLVWRSEEAIGDLDQIVGRPVRAETAVWVANSTTAELGYRPGGLEIIVDKDTFRAGETAPVMLTVPRNDQWVLFTTEAEELLSYQLVHVTGSVRLLQLPIEEKHVPNVTLSGVMASDFQMFADSEQVIVPPTKNFLNITATPDREQYEPGDEGRYTIRATDHEGKPVSAEIAFGVVDESVYYIQEDYAGDPRKFFYGQRRPNIVTTQSSFNHRPYQKVLELKADKTEEYYSFSDAKQQRNFTRGRAEMPAPAPAMAAGMAGSERQTLFKAGAAMDSVAEMSLGLAETRTASAAPSNDPAVEVRSDFRTSIFWQPDLKTDASGETQVTFKYPDSLTGWKATARAATAQNQFGITTETTRTKKALIVRLQAPRFFVSGDTVTVSAVLNNNTDESLNAAVQIVLEGITAPSNAQVTITVPANGESRADWVLNPTQPGEVKIKVIARAPDHSDAMEKTYTVYEHGIDKFIATSGKVGGDEVIVQLDLPKERRKGSTKLFVQVTPSLAVTMLDALPYLIDYPYGCTEQTMSRFLPAAITAKTLKDLGLHPEDVMSRAFGGIEPEHVSKTQPKGKNDLAKLDDIVTKGMQRLYDFQHPDGSWGWWKESASDRWMTAYVVWGLTLARDAGVEVRNDSIERATSWLTKDLVNAEQQPDMQAWMLHALAVGHEDGKALNTFQAKAFENLMQNRDQLNAYTRALLALSAHYFQKTEEAKTLVRNLENGVQVDDSPSSSVLIKSRQGSDAEMKTAHWGSDGLFWRWSDGGIEATAFALRALLAIDPDNKLIEPVTNWLIKNRRGAQWSNTRDTAITILAMNDYLRASGETEAEVEYELFVNEQSLGSKKLSGTDVFNAPSKSEVPHEAIGEHNVIRIVRKSGASPIYFAAQAEFFSLEEPVQAAGNEIFVRRDYYKLTAQPTLLKGYVYSKDKLPVEGTIQSGDRVEVVLTIEAKNNYEYLVLEDLKPAGLEAVEVRSGESLHAWELKQRGVDRRFGEIATTEAEAEPSVEEGRNRDEQTGRSAWVYQELRDRKVALFIDKLPQGIWEIRYELRGEVPGQFHALPVITHAMYVPEIRANSTESHLSVEDRTD